MARRVRWSAVVAVIAAVATGLALAAPGNDGFPGQTIAGATGSAGGSNVDATAETDEPAELAGVSVWYSWTAAAKGPMCFITSDAAFDPVLGVWTGAAVDDLTQIAFEDDVSTANGLDVRAGVAFEATDGETYHVGVGGSASTALGTTGSFTLAWGAGCLPPNTVIDSLVVGKNRATLSFHGADDLTAPASLSFQCRLDFGGAWVACSSPHTFTGVPGGYHAFFVRAADGNGNVDTTPARRDGTVKGSKSPS